MDKTKVDDMLIIMITPKVKEIEAIIQTALKKYANAFGCCWVIFDII